MSTPDEFVNRIRFLSELWTVNVSVFNKFWTSIYPSLVAKVWAESSNFKDCGDQLGDPGQCFKQVLGKDLIEYVNFNKSYYSLVGMKLPRFMQVMEDFIQSNENLSLLSLRIKNARKTCEESQDVICNAVTSIANSLERALIEIDLLKEKNQIQTHVDNALTIWNENSGDLEPFAPLGLSLQELNSFVTNEYNLPDPVGDASFPPVEQILPSNIIYEINKELCYDYLITNNRIILPFPERPISANEVFNMYVIRETGSPPLVIPGMNLGVVGNNGPANAMDGGLGNNGLGGVALDERCKSIESVIRTQDNVSWWFSGAKLQRLVAGLPRAVAAIWSDDDLYGRFVIMSRSEITAEEQQIADAYFTTDKILSEQVPLSLDDRILLGAQRETINSTIRLQSIALAESIKEIQEAQAELVSLLGSLGDNPGEDDKSFIEKISIELSAIRSDNVVEMHKDISRVIDLTSRIMEESGLDLRLVLKDLNEGKGKLNSTISSDSELVREKTRKLYRNFIEEYLEYDFPELSKVESVSSEDQIDMTLTNEAVFLIPPNDEDQPLPGFRVRIKIPFPERPSLDELFESWSTGESGSPTFTSTNLCP